MLLNKIKIVNFRQFKGEQIIEFSTDPNKNVTVLLGKNTGGKSTFVQAFSWVLYNVAVFEDKKAKDKELLNSDVAHEMRKDDVENVLVELTLEHKNVEYLISRRLEFVSRISGSATCDSDSLLTVMFRDSKDQFRRTDAGFKAKINEILPQDLSDYFFFDGERLMKVSDKSNLETAVNTIMGLTPVKNMISHIDPGSSGTAFSEFNRKLVDDGKGDAQALNAKRERLLAAIQSKEGQLKIQKDLGESIQRQYESAIRSLESQKQVINLINQRKGLEEEKYQDMLWVQDTLDTIREKFNTHCFDIFSSPLMENSMNHLKSADMSDKGIPEMNAVAIDYLIKRGYCVCGSSLKDNEEALKHIKSEQENLPPNSIGVSISNYTTSVDLRLSKLNSYLKDFKKAYDSYIRAADQVASKQKAIDDISDEIGRPPEVAHLEESYQSAKANKEKNAKNIESLISEIGAFNSQLQEVDGKQRYYESLDGINDGTKKCLAYTRALHQRMTNIYEAKQTHVLTTLRSTIKEIFPKMYHGVRTIDVDKNYRVSLTVENRGTLPNTPGLNTVKNFAFIAALLKMAKESMSDEDGVVSEPYPLVMDAPFSNADAEHISNITKVLPNFAQQVIVALMEKDWRLAERGMSDHVAKIYVIDKQSETYTKIREA
jgi:DNA sulfur modification protein DndD